MSDLTLRDFSPVGWSHPDVPAQPPGPGAVGVSGQHALAAAQVVGTVGYGNLHQARVRRHKQQTLQKMENICECVCNTKGEFRAEEAFCLWLWVSDFKKGKPC